MPVVMIGLDGVPLSLVRPWMEDGTMPALAALARDGVSGDLASTVPPVSGPAWSGFASGCGPGRTGVYDFLTRRDADYVFRVCNATDNRAETVWQRLSRAGRRVCVVNVPQSYPVEPVNGAMLSGWMTPHGADDHIHPPGLAAELTAATGGFQIYPDMTYRPDRREAFYRRSRALLASHGRVHRWLLRREPWDLYVGVFFDTDRILHQVWHELDSDHPWRAAGAGDDRSGDLRAYFRAIDDEIAALRALAPDDALFAVLSDHGMGAAHRFLILNNWLLEAGFLVLKDGPATRVKRSLFERGFTLRAVHEAVDRLGLSKLVEYRSPYAFDAVLKRVFLSFRDVDWSRSRAYAYGRHLGSIYVNLRGREPGGCVAPGAEYEAVLAALRTGLEAFRDPETDEPLVGRVVRGDALYDGPHTERAPDLVAWAQRETDIFYGLSDFGSRRTVEPTYRYSGMHREAGMLVMAGPGLRRGATIEGARLVDLAPTCLWRLGETIPDDIDGRPLTDAFEPEAIEASPPRFAERDSVAERAPRAHGEVAEAELLGRLRDLGYFG